MLAVSGVALVAAPAVAACGSDSGTQINVYYAPEQNFQSVIDRCNDEAGGRYEIVYRKLPRDADGQREQMVRRLAAGDTDLDILGLDVTWVPEFAEAEWLEEWTGADKSAAEDGVLEGPLRTAMWDDRLFAATKNTNVQLLWYDDTVTPEPPTTWREMIDMAKALELLKEVTSEGITDPSLTNAQEQQVQQAFEKPDSEAAFELNWPYVYAAMQTGNPDRAEHFKWARYPGIDGPSRVTIGGYNLAVSSYSQHKPEAFEAALCLRSAESQKFSAIRDGVPPTLESVYDDDTPLDPSQPEDAADNPSMTTAYPMKETIQEELQDPAVRPLTVIYQNLSTITSKVLSPPQDIDPEATAEELRDGLQKALDSKGVLP
ncbi:MAG: extracellular solute-binding protein [Pseudonocardiaceae bacterium]|nr:extracellular solute-binding protein [Pseudonocardiaceae bacterium]